MVALADFKIDYLSNGSLSVAFPYDPLAVQLIRAMPGRRWDKDKKYWTIPRTSLRTLQEQAGRRGIGIALSDTVRTALNLGKEKAQQLVAAKTDETPFTLPTNTNPYPFQYAGIRYAKYALHNFKGALIGDDQGLGKTFEALSIVAMHDKINSVLVLCQGTMKYEWADQIREHYPQLSYTVIDGNPQKRKEQWAEEGRIKIVNYELLLRDAEPRILTWDLVIADEVGTMLKNYKAQRTKRTKKLKRRYTLALSGIFLENKLEELHSVMDFVIPGLLGPGWLFVHQHVVKDYWGNPIGYRGLDQVKERIAPYYIRRTKKEVLHELPDKIYNPVKIEMSDKEWDLYATIQDQIREKIKENPKLAVVNILTEILRLKQVTNDARLLDVENIPSTKLATVRDIVDASDGHQLVVFTQFAQFAEILGQEFEAPIIQGSVDNKRRHEIISEFQNGEHKILISTDAGAYGITLTAADIVVHMDASYNPAKMRQREDRLHRIGRPCTYCRRKTVGNPNLVCSSKNSPDSKCRPNNVQVIDLICQRTVDEKVRSILHKKLHLINTILDEDTPEIETPHITKNELIGILG